MDHLLHRGVHQPGQTHAAVLGLVHGAVPATFDEGGVGLVPTVRRAHDAVDQSRALASPVLLDMIGARTSPKAGRLPEARPQPSRGWLPRGLGSRRSLRGRRILQHKPHVPKGCCIYRHDCAPTLTSPTAAFERRQCITARRATTRRRGRGRAREADILNLPRRRLRQRSEHDALRHLEARHLIAAELDDILFGGARAILQGDERAWRFAPFVVRTGDNPRLQDIGMTVEHVFNLDRRNVLAARNDDVLRPVLDLDVAIFVPDGEIARMEPAALKGFAGGMRVLQIALHDVVAAHQDLADCSAVAGYRLEGSDRRPSALPA